MEQTRTTTTRKRKALIIGGGIAGPVVAMALQRAGFEVAVYEARTATMDEAGAFLNLSPNGRNVLKTLGVDARLAAAGFPTTGIRLFNRKGKWIGALNSDREEAHYGAHNLMIKRGHLHKVLREAAQQQGIAIEFGKQLIDIALSATPGVIAHFADGATVEGDLLIGCDGLHSRTRQIMLPDGPQPTYTGLLDCGGFTQVSVDLPSDGAQQMTFGHRAFFGYFVKPEEGAPEGSAQTGGNQPREVWWFSNVPWPTEPTHAELQAISSSQWKQRLLALHGDDPAPIPQIIKASEGGVGLWPIYDMPPLPTWHKGPLCLVGDAAHAISPHAGQGASLALEDALVLAKCLRDIPEQTAAFATYQRLRKDRVERIVQQARRTGDHKIPHPLLGWLRDRLLPLFLKAGAAQTAQWYSYKVEWNTQVV